MLLVWVDGSEKPVRFSSAAPLGELCLFADGEYWAGCLPDHLERNAGLYILNQSDP